MLKRRLFSDFWSAPKMGIHRFPYQTHAPKIEDPVARTVAALVGSRLAALRMDRGLPRYVVAQRTGIHAMRITKLEEGSSVARLDEIVKLARVYGADRALVLEDMLGQGPE